MMVKTTRVTRTQCVQNFSLSRYTRLCRGGRREALMFDKDLGILLLRLLIGRN